METNQEVAERHTNAIAQTPFGKSRLQDAKAPKQKTVAQLQDSPRTRSSRYDDSSSSQESPESRRRSHGDNSSQESSDVPVSQKTFALRRLFDSDPSEDTPEEPARKNLNPTFEQEGDEEDKWLAQLNQADYDLNKLLGATPVPMDGEDAKSFKLRLLAWKSLVTAEKEKATLYRRRIAEDQPVKASIARSSVTNVAPVDRHLPRLQVFKELGALQKYTLGPFRPVVQDLRL